MRGNFYINRDFGYLLHTEIAIGISLVANANGINNGVEKAI